MRAILGALLFLFLPGCTVAFVHQAGLLLDTSAVVWSCLIGTCLGILADEFLLRRVPGLETFEHELTHAIASLMLFRRITRFVVTRHSGGWVSHSGGFGGEIGNEFIGLAPYVLPTFTVFSALARPLVPASWFPWIDIWIGVTFGFHLWSTAREIRQNWTARPFVMAGTAEWSLSDIGERGFIYSFVFIASVTLAIHGILLAIILHGYDGVLLWARDVWRVTSDLLALLMEWIHRLVLEIRS